MKNLFFIITFAISLFTRAQSFQEGDTIFQNISLGIKGENFREESAKTLDTILKFLAKNDSLQLDLVVSLKLREKEDFSSFWFPRNFHKLLRKKADENNVTWNKFMVTFIPKDELGLSLLESRLDVVVSDSKFNPCHPTKGYLNENGYGSNDWTEGKSYASSDFSSRLGYWKYFHSGMDTIKAFWFSKYGKDNSELLYSKGDSIIHFQENGCDSTWGLTTLEFFQKNKLTLNYNDFHDYEIGIKSDDICKWYPEYSTLKIKREVKKYKLSVYNKTNGEAYELGHILMDSLGMKFDSFTKIYDLTPIENFEFNDSIAFSFSFIKGERFIRIKMDYSGTYLPEIERISVGEVYDEYGEIHFIPIHEIGDFNHRRTIEINQQIIGF